MDNVFVVPHSSQREETVQVCPLI